MSDHGSTMIRYSAGRGKNLAKAKNKALPYAVFKNQFREPVRTGERFKEYLKLPHAEQVQLKGVNGWFFRSQIEGERRTRDSARPTDIITLDFDYATPEFIERIISGDVLPGVLWFCHSSRRHTEDKPRLRFVIVLSEPLPNDAYGPISRIICKLIDPEMVMVDPVSFRPAQMMFMPTASADGDWFFHESDGEPLDWYAEGEIFNQTVGDWRDFRVLPTAANENLRARVDKAEDPTQKKGMVGDFCRAYTVPEAIAKFLPDLYEPVNDASLKPRYTYLKGTTTNGAVVEDDGLFLYSHHGSDPCADMLVNAFDLVRIHLFGDQDDKIAPDTPQAKRPSWSSMAEMLDSDAEYTRAQVASRYDMTAQFTDEDIDGDVEIDEAASGPLEAPAGALAAEDDVEDMIADLVGLPVVVEPLVPAVDVGYRPVVPGKRRPKPPKDWVAEMDLSRDGRIVNTPDNVRRLLTNDMRLRESMEFNEFTRAVVIRHPMRLHSNDMQDVIPTDTRNGDRWEDHMTTRVRMLLSAQNGPDKPGWGVVVPTGGIDEVVEVVARELPFHPIKDMLTSVAWDGQPRAETLFIDHLGAEDNTYTRSVARLFLVAAVTRVFEPGHKFDFVPILEGPQGIRKSSFVETLACGYFGSLTADMDDERALTESMRGRWVLEMPELSSLKRSGLETVKAFITRAETSVRMAYARREEVFKRQCVFMGTTNEETYLIDKTGNRRWWPIRVGVDLIDLDRLAAEMPQVWAEALHLYAAMRRAQPEGTLPLYLTDPRAVAISEAMQDVRVQASESDHIAGKIAEWLTRPTSDSKFDDSTERYPDVTCISQVWSEAMGESGNPSRMDSLHIGQALKTLGWVASGRSQRFPGYGVQKPFTPTVSGREVSGDDWRQWWWERLVDVTPPEDLI